LLRFGPFEPLTTTISWVKLLWGRGYPEREQGFRLLPDDA
jgi:hypothetical protein